MNDPDNIPADLFMYLLKCSSCSIDNVLLREMSELQFIDKEIRRLQARRAKSEGILAIAGMLRINGEELTLKLAEYFDARLMKKAS